jgi:multiple sugar transport system ATP-binding protein
MATVTFQGATRIYPKSNRKAVDRLDLEIKDGEFLVLVGPSGCGKTTSLRMLAGLEDVDEGSILIDDKDVVNLPPRSRDIAMVFQNYALYPHMNVAENMGFALKIARMPKAEIRSRVQEAAKILDLEDYLKRKPGQLSGGQRQRVAMGRAIVRQPRVFLMDEPLSNLDAKLRVATRSEIASLQRRLGVTTVYVTHDQVEAMTMGDRVAVMKDGVLQQCDTPRVLYESPVNSFVAGFIGSPAMNLIEGHIDAGGLMLGETVIPIPAKLREQAGAVGTTVTQRSNSLDLRGVRVIAQPQRRAGQQLVGLVGPAQADDRAVDGRVAQRPGDRDRARRDAEALGDRTPRSAVARLALRRGSVKASLLGASRPPACARSARASSRRSACRSPSASRRSRRCPALLRVGQDLLLHVAHDQRVRAAAAFRPARSRRSAQLLDAEVRDPDVAHEPLVAQRRQRRPALLDVLRRPRPVDLVEVDRVDAQAREARLGLAADRVALQAAHDRRPGPSSNEHFVKT